jgi:Ca2+-binding RTX toxin-like protein
MLFPLEGRVHLSAAAVGHDGTLLVRGTSGDDVIRVSADDLTSRPGFPRWEVYTVRVNGETTTFDAEVVERVVIEAGAGDDDVRVAYSTHGIDLVWSDGTPVEIPVTLRGGRGDDLLQGGDGDDVLVGGAGDDTLLGNAGRDALFGNAGRDRLVGGPGIDKNVGGAGRDQVVDSKRKFRFDRDDDFWFISWGGGGLKVGLFF